MTAALLDGTDVALVHRHDTALLDLDGVLYVGRAAVPDAPAAVAAAREAGLRVAFVTNNAARTPATVAAHLRELGVPATPADVITSAQAVATLVADQVPAGSAVLVVGGDGLEEAVREQGFRPVRTAAESPAAVVQGFAPDVGWSSLAEGAFAVGAGVPWFASNLDLTIPTEGGLAPGNGSLVEVIATATGRRPTASAGKPETPLHDEAVRRTGARDPLVVGDRLDTDIEGANLAGVASLLVLTGVASPVDLVLAGASSRPTYVAEGLRSGLLEPHPPVTRTGDGHSCGGWTVEPADTGFRASGSGHRVDGLRAAAAAAWASAQPVDRDSVTDLLRTIGW